MKFEYPDFIQLALLPTPIERLEKFSKEIGGANIFIKRDDNTDVVLSGNKVRKLEFLLADAVSGNCDTIITCGGIQSNHARTTAIAAAKLNLTCYLVLKNGQPAQADGNLLLNQLVGAKIKLISPEEYKNVDHVMNEIADRLKFEGKNPYVIPEF